MGETLITFETAKLAKEKGFDNKSQKGYYKHGDINLLLWIDSENYNNQKDFLCEASTQSLLQKWLREVHGIHIVIIPTVTSHWTYKTLTVLSERDNDIIKGIKSVSDLPPYDNVCGEDFSTYESALEDALQKSLILIN
mgnify:FL=1